MYKKNATNQLEHMGLGSGTGLETAIQSGSSEQMEKRRPQFQIISSSDGGRVWINGADGSAIGRFNKNFGIDVHTTATAQRNGASECLYCTHGEAGPAEWEEFRKQVKTHYDIDVPEDLIQWNGH